MKFGIGSASTELFLVATRITHGYLYNEIKLLVTSPTTLISYVLFFYNILLQGNQRLCQICYDQLEYTHLVRKWDTEGIPFRQHAYERDPMSVTTHPCIYV